MHLTLGVVFNLEAREEAIEAIGSPVGRGLRITLLALSTVLSLVRQVEVAWGDKRYAGTTLEPRPTDIPGVPPMVLLTCEEI